MDSRPIAKQLQQNEHISLAEKFALEMADRFSGSELREISHTIRDIFKKRISITIEENEQRVHKTNEQISTLKDCLEDI